MIQAWDSDDWRGRETGAVEVSRWCQAGHVNFRCLPSGHLCESVDEGQSVGLRGSIKKNSVLTKDMQVRKCLVVL